MLVKRAVLWVLFFITIYKVDGYVRVGLRYKFFA
jgi:hypothetical protein